MTGDRLGVNTKVPLWGGSSEAASGMMRGMGNWRTDRIGSAIRGENPTVLARMPAGFAVIGDVQWLPGYCVLLSDDPVATLSLICHPTCEAPTWRAWRGLLGLWKLPALKPILTSDE